MAKKELDILFPQEKKLVIGGQEFIIREFVASEFSDVIALGSALGGDLASAIQEDPERLFRLISSVTGVPDGTIKKMRLTALAKVVGELVEANADFFTQSLPKLIQKVAQAVQDQNSGSNSSSS